MKRLLIAFLWKRGFVLRRLYEDVNRRADYLLSKLMTEQSNYRWAMERVHALEQQNEDLRHVLREASIRGALNDIGPLECMDRTYDLLKVGNTDEALAELEHGLTLLRSPQKEKQHAIG